MQGRPKQRRNKPVSEHDLPYRESDWPTGSGRQESNVFM